MPPPMMSTSSAGLPSGPSTAGTQFGRGKTHALEVVAGGGRQLVEPGGERAAEASGWLGKVIAPRPILPSCAIVSSSACIVARSPEPTLCPWRVSCTVSSFRSTMSICAAGSRLVGGHDIDEPMARVVALDAVAARREDARPVDGEMAGPQAPLAVDSVGACRRRCEAKARRPQSSPLRRYVLRAATLQIPPPFSLLQKQASRIGRARQSAREAAAGMR